MYWGWEWEREYNRVRERLASILEAAGVRLTLTVEGGFTCTLKSSSSSTLKNTLLYFS